MSAAERGEVLFVRLSDSSSGRDARGAEQGADQKGSIRPCVIVSHTAFNQRRDRVTVVPLTNYSEIKDDSMGRWSAVVAPGRGLNTVATESKPPNVGARREQKLLVTYFDSADLINELERHLHEARSAATNDVAPWKRSLIDCGQLWTVFAINPDAANANHEHRVLGQPLGRLNDVKWAHRRARLNQDAMFNVNSALQVVLSADVRLLHRGLRSDLRMGIKESDLRYQQGDVIRIDLPGHPAHLCVVVSSTSQDYLRSRVYSREHDRHFALVTVVPLTHGGSLNHTAPNVSVYRPNDFTAACQEIWTVFWPERNTERVAELSQPDFEKVQRGVRFYLGLPSLEASAPK